MGAEIFRPLFPTGAIRLFFSLYHQNHLKQGFKTDWGLSDPGQYPLPFKIFSACNLDPIAGFFHRSRGPSFPLQIPF